MLYTSESPIKSGVNYQKSRLPQFIDKLHTMIKKQEHEFKRAVTDRGNLKLNPQYQHLSIPEFKWYSQMSEQDSHLNGHIHPSQIFTLLKILHKAVLAYQLILRVQVLTCRFQVVYLKVYGRRPVSS